MQNKPGTGPTRADKTLERMKQERQSPGATTAGGHSADASNDDMSSASDSFRPAGPPTTSSNSDMRRGDVAAAKSVDAARASPSEAPDAIDVDTPPASSPTREDRIRQAAYLLSQRRAEFSGDAVADWLQAEAEVDALENQSHTAADSSPSQPG